MKAQDWLLLFYDPFSCLDNLDAAGGLVPSARKIKIHVIWIDFSKIEEIII